MVGGLFLFVWVGWRQTAGLCDETIIIFHDEGI